jgi:hypothetical protein
LNFGNDQPRRNNYIEWHLSSEKVGDFSSSIVETNFDLESINNNFDVESPVEDSTT